MQQFCLGIPDLRSLLEWMDNDNIGVPPICKQKDALTTKQAEDFYTDQEEYWSQVSSDKLVNDLLIELNVIYSPTAIKI